MIVPDIKAGRDALVARGVEVSEVLHAGTPGAQFQPYGTSGRLSGPAPDHDSYGSFDTFSDPDRNGWLLQEVTTRLPGRIEAAETTFASTADLASALRRGPPTASTRSAPGNATRTGPTGTPTTWRASRAARSCLREWI